MRATRGTGKYRGQPMSGRLTYLLSPRATSPARPAAARRPQNFPHFWLKSENRRGGGRIRRGSDPGRRRESILPRSGRPEHIRHRQGFFDPVQKRGTILVPVSLLLPLPLSLSPGALAVLHRRNLSLSLSASARAVRRWASAGWPPGFISLSLSLHIGVSRCHCAHQAVEPRFFHVFRVPVHHGA